jgi:hypothetical protein
MPTDNVAIAGSSDVKGTVGQIIAWTVTYSGGTTLNQDAAGSTGPGNVAPRWRVHRTGHALQSVT